MSCRGPTVRLHGRRERGYTVPVVPGGPEMSGRLVREFLSPEPSPVGDLMRAILLQDAPRFDQYGRRIGEDGRAVGRVDDFGRVSA